MLAGAICLCWPLIWNGFPFVYYDTESYLLRFQSDALRLVHPVYYSIWLAAFNLFPYGLFLAVIAQAIVTAALLYKVIESFHRQHCPLLFLLCIVALAVSPTVFHIVTLMPDVATLWLAMAMALISENTMKARILAALVVIICLSFHNSHFLIFLTLIPLPILRSPRKPVLVTLVAIFASQFALIAINNKLAGAALLESPSAFFLAGRLNQTTAFADALSNLGDEWAEEVRPLTRTPEAFEWWPTSPLNKTYPHWSSNYGEYLQAKARVKPAVDLALRQDWRGFLHTGKHNITSMMVGEYIFQGFAKSDESVRNAVRLAAPREYSVFENSRQQTGRFPIIGVYASLWRRLFYWLTIGAIPLCLFFFFNKRFAVSSILSIAFIANLFVCGFLASIPTRYIEKVIGLVIIALILAVACLRKSVQLDTAG